MTLYAPKFNSINVAGKKINFSQIWKKENNMLSSDCNGTLMPSCESEVVKNDAFLSKLEKKVISLSEKYSLGNVLFMEKNPKNNNSSNAFIIKAPEEWSNQKIFDVWEPISNEVHDFARKEGIKYLSEICSVIVSNRY